MEIRADLRREAQAKGLPSSQELPVDPGWEPPAIDEPAWSDPQAKAARRKPRARLRRRPPRTALPPGGEPPA